MKSGASHQWKSYSRCLALSSEKTENQSSTRATRILDPGTECNLENTLGKEIQTPINATAVVENTVESPFSTRPSTEEESHVKDFRSDNNDDSARTRTEMNSRDDTSLIEDQDEEEKCSIERRNSNTSSDYEKISITDYKVSTHDLEVPDRTESIACIYMIEKNSPVPPKAVTKSQSVNDLATREATYEDPFVGYSKQDAGSITSDENDDVSSRHKKKKRRFTRNVLYYVPRHLVKQPKKKKKKLKKKHTLSSSLSSLRSLQEPFPGPVPDSCTKIRSLSRDELRSVIISSPTNFVHVASATNPNLVRNPVGLDVEQIVITHQQICATLPLLVRKDERGRNGNIEQPKVATRMSPADDVVSRQSGQNRSAVESVAGTFS